MSQYKTAPWPIKDVSHAWPRKLIVGGTDDCLQIIYTGIVGTVMIAAFVEWFMWLGAFLYCLVKVFQKAESTLR